MSTAGRLATKPVAQHAARVSVELEDFLGVPVDELTFVTRAAAR